MADDKTKDEETDSDAADDATATELNEDELDDDDDGAPDDDDDDDDDESDSPNTKRGKSDDDDDDELLDDDVEEDLDKILKDRLVAADDEEAEADTKPVRGAGGEQLQPKQRDEQLCSSCFLLVRSNAPNCPIGDDDCPIFS